MKSLSSILTSRRILFLGAVLLFALGIFSPQNVEARAQQMIVPVYEGDPRDGLDASHGGGASGGAQPHEPLEDGKDNNHPGGLISSLKELHTVSGNQSVILFDLRPHFDGQTIVWTISFIFSPIQGGGR